MGSEHVLQLSLRRLSESERRLRLVFERAPVGMLLLDEHARVIDTNQAFRSLVGRGAEDLVGAPYALLLHSGEPTDPRAVAGERRRFVHADGREVWAAVSSVVLEDGASAHQVLLCAEDVTERRVTEAQLVHDAMHDSLTNLPNRRLMRDRLETALARASRTGSTVAVLFLDLDEFKSVNDSLGHDAGDDLLVAVGRNLASTLRACDTVSRLGGDEFVVVCEDVAEEGDVDRLATRVMEAVRQPITLLGQRVQVTASIGVATPATDHGSPDELLRLADMAMYRAKRSGKARYVIVDDGVHEETAARLDLVADLRRAIQRDELALHYQPVTLLDGALIGMEALLRWPHPALGLLRPADFIPLVEGTEVAKPLSDWVLRRAVSDACRWGNGSLRVAVNVSVCEIARPDFVDTVAELLSWSGLRPRSLWLDVPEAELASLSPTARAAVDRLRALGVGVAVDDFGRGAVSLADLKGLPVDLVKIHPSFVAGMLDDPLDAAIVSAIAAAARASGRHALAEGVETPGQLAKLRELGLESVQGHLTARPAPLADLRDVLDHRRVRLG